MRCLRLESQRHLDGSVSWGLVVPITNRRTKRRTLKKWLRRQWEFAMRQVRR